MNDKLTGIEPEDCSVCGSHRHCVVLESRRKETWMLRGECLRKAAEALLRER